MDADGGSTVAIRTCVACRGKADRTELTRFVLEGRDVVLDVAKSAAGRGAWLHLSCVSTNLDSQFSRAFRKRVFTGRLVAQVYTESKAESMQTQK